jgi:TubC N-terminal docking domain
MMTPSPAAVRLLADLAAAGIDVESLGGAIRFRPRHAMTPDFLQRLQENKAELVRILDADAAGAALRQSIERLWKDPAWRSAWERRFHAGRYADFASLRRVLDLILEQAAEHHRRHDWSEFASACRYLHRLAAGEIWDGAERLPDPRACNREI